jgi:hypothetical protein
MLKSDKNSANFSEYFGGKDQAQISQIVPPRNVGNMVFQTTRPPETE